LAYQPPASSTFLSEQIRHQQPANSNFLSEQISTGYQPPAKRIGGVLVLTRTDDRRLLPPNLVRQKSVGWFYWVHRFIENGVHHNILQPGNLDVFGKFPFYCFCTQTRNKLCMSGFFYIEKCRGDWNPVN
jgi:hypothetical protein